MRPAVAQAPADRYVVVEYLSEGGMGAIYIGKKLGAGGFEKEVVLKQLLPEFTKQQEFIDLFLREARLSATLDHANIIHTIDFVTAGQDYFIVMEYLAGGDLRSMMLRAKRRGKRWSAPAALYIAREVLAALGYAHAKRDLDGQPMKLIHRDVSPSNVLISENGEIKLTDFGIAKAATHTSLFYRVKGKIGYMAPEQAKSDPMDHRSDLYSLAVCLYEMLANERLFANTSLTISADEMYAQPIPSVAKKYKDIPKELDDILAKALALKPAERYQTAGEFAEALTRCAYRHSMMLSAAELTEELVDICGPSKKWRDEPDDIPSNRQGTAVLSDEDDDADDDADGYRDFGPGRSGTKLPNMRGRELTSVISLDDLEILREDSPLFAKASANAQGGTRGTHVGAVAASANIPPLPPGSHTSNAPAASAQPGSQALAAASATQASHAFPQRPSASALRAPAGALHTAGNASAVSNPAHASALSLPPVPPPPSGPSQPFGSPLAAPLMTNSNRALSSGGGLVVASDGPAPGINQPPATNTALGSATAIALAEHSGLPLPTNDALASNMHSAGRRRQPRATDRKPNRQTHREETSTTGVRFRWWMALLALLLIGVAATILIALSGPSV